jgi:hypothetical protein
LPENNDNQPLLPFYFMIMRGKAPSQQATQTTIVFTPNVRQKLQRLRHKKFISPRGKLIFRVGSREPQARTLPNPMAGRVLAPGSGSTPVVTAPLSNSQIAADPKEVLLLRSLFKELPAHHDARQVAAHPL